MARVIVEAAEQLLDQEIKVLDKGFVRLVDYMGSDERIVQAARVSYGSGTKSFRQDKGLINYLMRNQHTSPFEQVILTFHTKMPIFVARQWVRHRTARLNEISGRYSIMKDEFYVPDAGQMRGQSDDNKQARSDEIVDDAAAMIVEMEADQRLIYDHYTGMVDQGLAREIARSNLPLSLYTEWYWQIDLHNLFRFLHLRMDGHAQYEIRVYAEAMAKCSQAVSPLAYDAFEEHMLNSVRFSRQECVAMSAIMAGQANPLEGRALAIFEQKIATMNAIRLPEDDDAGLAVGEVSPV
ncbi:MAG: FAD-dependent thymidylate synthase [Fimbriimonadaceae bacterium]